MTSTSNQYNSQNPTGYPNGSYGYPGTPELDDSPINYKKYLNLFLSNWYWFLIVLGIALGVAFFKIRYAIPQYQANATLIIENEQAPGDVLSQIKTVNYLRRQTDMANEIAKLTSFPITLRTMDHLDRHAYWSAHGRIRERHLYKNPFIDLQILNDSIDWFKDQKWYISLLDDGKYRFYQETGLDTILSSGQEVDLFGWRFIISNKSEYTGHNTYHFVVNRKLTLAKQYMNKLRVETDEKQGTIITVSSEGPVGEREVDFLNALCNTFILSELERKQQTAENTFQFIDNQIDIILDSLSRAEEQLLAFRLSNNVINLSRDGEMAYEQLKGFIESKTQLRLKANYYNYLERYVEARKDPQTIISPTLTDTNDALLVAAVQKLQELYEERENLDFSVAEDNPSVENINLRIQSTRLRIIEIIEGLKENNQLTLDQINTEEGAVIEQLKSLPLNEQQLLNIKRKYDLYNQFYTFLLQKRAEAGIQKASTISNARILDPARYDQLTMVGDNKNTLLILALIMGFLVPAIIIILRDLLDNRIREREDVTNQTDIPILGIIGHSSQGGYPIKHVAPNSSFTEALRRIRSNVQFTLKDPNQKVIMVTSSISGEGKTFTATNLAIVFAMNNKNVLLVGCDLRKPTLHRLFNIENRTGLSSVIIGEESIKTSIVTTNIKNLSLLPSGPVPPNPAELLETDKINSIFSTLKQKYDYIILDTPPVALVSDSLSLAHFADMTLYVVRQNYSQKDVIDIANQLKNEDRLPNIALLINDIKPSKTLGYNYYYGYNQGYNYGYYQYASYSSGISEQEDEA